MRILAWMFSGALLASQVAQALINRQCDVLVKDSEGARIAGAHVHVYRDELFSLQVDGTLGSAVAGLRECRTQHRVNTPRPVWNPDIENSLRFREQWQDVPDNQIFDNGFKLQWELFLKHIAEDAPFPHDFAEGARGVQLAELGLKSWQERRWIDVPELGA